MNEIGEVGIDGDVIKKVRVRYERDHKWMHLLFSESRTKGNSYLSCK
ncbi:hypothetical protein [Methanosarcina barkeri]|nr:hypothetical protein [Methanosarcina barkeri]